MRLRRRRPSGRGVVVVGAGGMAAVHAAAIPAAGEHAVAVASRTAAGGRHLAGELDVRRVGIDSLPGGAGIVVVATPTPTHAGIAGPAVATGALTLLESPWCTSIEDAEQLATLDRNGPGRVRGAVALRCAPLWSTVLGLADGPGRLHHLSACFTQPRPDWGHLAARTGGADGFDERGLALTLLGTPAVTLVEDLARARVADVSAVASSTSGGPEATTGVRLTLGFDTAGQDTVGRGVTATVDLAFADRAEVWFQAAGEGGVLRVEAAPTPLVEVDGAAVPLTGPSGPAGVDAAAGLRATGYVEQLRALGGPDDRTADTATIRRITGLLSAADRSLRLDGRRLPLD